MKQETADGKEEYLVLQSERDGLLCRFLLKDGFTNGVIASHSGHFHSAWELLLPVTGEMCVMAGDRELVVCPGEVCLIPPQLSHFVQGDAGAYRMGFRFTYERTGKGESALYEVFGRAFDSRRGACVLRCPVYEKYLRAAAENRRRGYPAFTVTELLLLSLWELSTVCTGVEEERQGTEPVSDDQLSERIEEFLNRSYSRKLYLHELAEELNLSRRQTERIIKRLFGMTFTELVNRRRLTAAKQLLRHTQLSAAEIAGKVGYPDQNYFYRRFSAAFSMTPGEYRRQERKLQRKGNVES